MKSRTAAKVVWFVLALLLAALLCGGAALMVSDALRQNVAAYLTQVSFGARVGILCGCVIFLVLMPVALVLPYTGKSAPDLTLKNEVTGQVSITAEALEKMVEMCVKNITGVHDVRVRVSTKNGQIAYRIQTRVSGSVSVPEVVEKMRARVTDYVSSRIGTAVCMVDVTVVGCVSDQTAAVAPRVR